MVIARDWRISDGCEHTPHAPQREWAPLQPTQRNIPIGKQLISPVALVKYPCEDAWADLAYTRVPP